MKCGKKMQPVGCLYLIFSHGTITDQSQAWLMLSRKCGEMVKLRANEGRISSAPPVNEAIRDNRGHAYFLTHPAPWTVSFQPPAVHLPTGVYQSQTETLLRHCPTNAPLSSTSGHNTAAFQFWDSRTTIVSKSLPTFKWSVQQLHGRVLCTVCATWKSCSSKVRSYLLRCTAKLYKAIQSYTRAFVSFHRFV